MQYLDAVEPPSPRRVMDRSPAFVIPNTNRRAYTEKVLYNTWKSLRGCDVESSPSFWVDMVELGVR
jgi:hypothetical protein